MSKFCMNCGQELDDNASFCFNCGKNTSNNETKEENVNKTETTNKTNTTTNKYNKKSKVAAGLLGIFLGAFGVHNFYLGYNSKATAQLLITVLTCGVLSFVSGIWGFIEGIFILTGSINVDADGVPLGE